MNFTLSKWRKKIGKIHGYFFILPCLIAISFYIIYSVGRLFYISFQSWSGADITMKFIGFNNYYELFTRDHVFLIALKNTLLWAVLTISIQAGLGLLFAVLLDTGIKGKTVYRTILFLPIAATFSVIGMVWAWGMYQPQMGQVNAILKTLGLGSWTRAWLGEPDLAIFSIITVNIWEWTGWSMILYIAGLQHIPVELYEAAEVDGAGAIRRLWHITIPQLIPIHFTLLLLGIIGTLKTFDLVYIMTKGGPANSSHLIATKIFKDAFSIHRYGYACSVGVILFLIALVITVTNTIAYQRKRGI